MEFAFAPLPFKSIQIMPYTDPYPSIGFATGRSPAPGMNIYPRRALCP